MIHKDISYINHMCFDEAYLLLRLTGNEKIDRFSNGEIGFIQVMSFIDGYYEGLDNSIDLINTKTDELDKLKILKNDIKNKIVLKEKELRENDPVYKTMEENLDQSGETSLRFLNMGMIDKNFAVKNLTYSREQLFGKYMWQHLRQPYTPEFLNDTYDKYLKLIDEYED